MSGLYVHVPFCRQKCRYCDFASYAGAERYIDAYLHALDAEAKGHAPARFDTLYIGGGTPSLLSAAALEKLASLLARHFGPIADFTESTIEANPESITAEKLHVLRGAGINRISIGLQSFNDDVLKRIGRVHDRNTFLNAYKIARSAGFENINVDLIAGLPGQSEADFAAGLQQLTDLAPQHISVYGLQVEEGTPFAREGIQADDGLLRRELEQIHHVLTQAGFVHYEISNYALPGYESRHNMNYWQNGEYLGLGAAAASYQNGERRSNVPALEEYINRIINRQDPTDFRERLRGKSKEGEAVMLGLRMLGGVRLNERQKQLFAREIDNLCMRGLVVCDGDLIKLTFEGLFLANQAFMAFVEPFDNEANPL